MCSTYNLIAQVYHHALSNKNFKSKVLFNIFGDYRNISA